MTVLDMFTEEEKQLYKTSPEAYKAFRLELEDALNSVAAIGHEGSRLQEVLRNLCEEKMRQKLSSRPDIADGLIVRVAVSPLASPFIDENLTARLSTQLPPSYSRRRLS